MSVLVITGTDTGVGKTVVCAAIAAMLREQGHRVAVLKPAQTGVAPTEEGDLDVVRRFAGEVTTSELRRYPEPLAPEAAARRSGLEPLTPGAIAEEAVRLAETHDHVLVEGAGGLLVRFGPDGGTLADVAWSLGAPLVIVARAALGTLNATALTAEVATRRGVDVAGVVIGAWPREPGLAERCNLVDLPEVAGAPLLGALDEELSDAQAPEFLAAARRGLSPRFGGEFDAVRFRGDSART
ncbi:dethiobiotin synthase [Haloechinothrix sp. LS1_15]|uniref:dethiobiotin synthase n=1 Tax=Haloechinothrix sp. LS1_15 TaxID=2652248 RepID=UPI0029478A94|nr:dethiobiotin synthase [Haloechinothrix sp. LS1_15]MDV6012704.1 ATP-dependent dethiobiotin synthetase BioD [Haloechinothrix sp. LS1_15]